MTWAAPAAAAPTASRPLRIGILTDGLVERTADGAAAIGNGGVGVYIYQLVKHLREIDPINQYVTIRCGGGALDIYPPAARATHLALPSTPWNRSARWLDAPYPDLVAAHGLDLLHYPNQLGGAFLPRRIRRVVTLHDLTPLLFPRHHPRRSVLGYRLLLRRSLRAADRVIVDAEHTAADLRRRGLAAADRISVVPLGVEGRFRPDRRSPAFAARYDVPDRFILTVGVFEPRKNHARLLAALDRVHRADERIALVMVGRDGWRWRDPLADPRLAHLRPWVRCHRNVPDADLPEFYARAAVLAYPSLYEGFGLPVAEAMACGTPVVAARRASLPEVAGDAALYADPDDTGELAGQLLAVLRDPMLRQRLGVAGIARSRLLTWRRTAEETRAVYERVCRGE